MTPQDRVPCALRDAILRCPSLRVGELLVNVSPDHSHEEVAGWLFYVEDDDLVCALNAYNTRPR